MINDYCYVLKLQGDRYYVGYTTNIADRIMLHFLGLGSRWTRLYRPESVMLILKGTVDKEITHYNMLDRPHADNNAELTQNDMALLLYPDFPATISDMEKLLTLDLMLRYSISKVRGSSWTTPDMKPSAYLMKSLIAREAKLKMDKAKGTYTRECWFDGLSNPDFDYIKGVIARKQKLHAELLHA